MADRPIIQADFVKPNLVPSRKVLQLVFEVPAEAGDHAMAVLGGLPQSGTNRWCAIARLAEETAPDDAAEPQETPLRPPDECADDLTNQGAAEPRETEPAEDANATADWSEAKRRMVQKSGIIRNEKAFHDYVANGWPLVWNHERHKDFAPADRVAAFLHTACGVRSCRDLDPDGPSGAAFRSVIERYEDFLRR